MVPPLFQITNLVTHSTHDPPYEVSTINVGDPYYVDREYAYASLPVFMQYLNGIKTGAPNEFFAEKKTRKLPVDNSALDHSQRRLPGPCRIRPAVDLLRRHRARPRLRAAR